MSDVRFSGFAIPALFAASVAIAAPASKPDVVELVPHRAVYDLKLASARGNKPVESVRGRILYDFSGSACEGYALQFRQVSQIDAGEGAVMTTDLRATTWEDAAAKIFRFNSQNYIDQKLKTSVDGRAERTGVRVGVNLNKPAVKKFGLDQNGIFFPTDHMRRIILAARAGQTLLEGPVLEGSDNGDRIYDTLSVIGAPIDPQKKPDDAGAKDEVLLNMRRWPVSISYFERANDKPNKPGEQTPIYSIRFELYENGISRALALD
jgi:hypothetical protein